jgi:hypothetical protein
MARQFTAGSLDILALTEFQSVLEKPAEAARGHAAYKRLLDQPQPLGIFQRFCVFHRLRLVFDTAALHF